MDVPPSVPTAVPDPIRLNAPARIGLFILIYLAVGLVCLVCATPRDYRPGLGLVDRGGLANQMLKALTAPTDMLGGALGVSTPGPLAHFSLHAVSPLAYALVLECAWQVFRGQGRSVRKTALLVLLGVLVGVVLLWVVRLR